jgi:membrane glycosyltransferase
MRPLRLSELFEAAPRLTGKPFRMPLRMTRRIAFFALVLASSGWAFSMMSEILGANGLTKVEAMILALFTITFSWIVISFWSAVTGFVLKLLNIDPMSLRRKISLPKIRRRLATRTALVMPIYNEDPHRVLAGLEATYRSLMATGEGAAFDVFILSDTRKPGIAAAEEAGWQALVTKLNASGRIFYRRREKNTGRKAGNVADFCTRWGRHYEHMVVLDADSVMSGQAIVTLAHAMEDNPEAGIIQTVPMPVRQDTFFGRYVQFASRLYSPMLATGLAFWQMSECNYWGHNAIIRVAPFTAHCGLPLLRGRAPMGGEILSHDFVEAAFIRRAGWQVFLLPDLEGSFEEVPGNVVDYAQRDKRWAQGNMQHLKLIGAKGFHGINRLHFLLGALAYASSLLWLVLLLLTTVDAIMRAVIPHEFFSGGYQLFPDWPVVESDKIFSLFSMTVVMLLFPKVAGVLLTLFDRAKRRGFGGGLRLVMSALLETLFSIFLAPVMMCLHAYFVTSTLMGYVVTWDAQNRDGRNLSVSGVAPSLIVPTLAGILWGIVTWIWTPSLFLWLLPVTIGMALAIPLTVLSSRADWGVFMRRFGLWLTPEETMPPAELRQLATILAEPEATVTAGALAPQAAPEELLADMHPQRLDYPLDDLRRSSRGAASALLLRGKHWGRG